MSLSLQRTPDWNELGVVINVSWVDLIQILYDFKFQYRTE